MTLTGNLSRGTKLIAAVIVIALAATACASEDEVESSESPSPIASGTPAASPSPSPHDATGEEVQLEVWLASDAGLFPVTRSVERTRAVGRAALEGLLTGPIPAEEAAGLVTAVPESTSLVGLDISGGIATVDLSSEFSSGAGTASIRTRVAQVVFTLTQFSTVTSVVFKIEGEPAGTFSSEGLELDEPQRRKDYRDLLPPITVMEPAIGAEVSSPVTVSGTANVFEATVSMRLVVDGAAIAEGFATATCGTGCRGSYTHDLVFSVSEPTEATLEVFESSAEDGSPQHVVSVPVELLP